VIFIANDQDNPPFGLFINASNFAIMGRINWNGTFANNATNGLEQSIWNPTNDLFYLSVPETITNPGGEIDVISPITMNVTNVFPLPPGSEPHGLTLGPTQRLWVGASQINGPNGTAVPGTPIFTVIMNATSGQILNKIMGIGGTDEVWYNSGDNRFYVCGKITVDGTNNGSATGVIGVIDASSGNYLENIFIPGFNTYLSIRTAVADPTNNHIYAMLSRSGIGVLTDMLGNFTGQLNGQVTLLNTQMASLSTQLTALSTQATSLSSQISTLQGQATTAAQKSDLNSLSSQVTSL
jgi:hypothetical protein